MHFLHNKIPPPIWLLTFGAAMWFVAAGDSQFTFDIPYSLIIGVMIGASGLAIALSAILQFNRFSTTVNPLSPSEASKLVTCGIFSKTRNPMYLGLLMVLVGWGVWLGSLVNIALLVGFVLVLTFLQIKPEEQALRELFGSAFDDYCQRVRRWI